MTDLEINIALAKAMGWVNLTRDEWFYSDRVGYRIYENKVQCSYGHLHGFNPFDYRDPVIFVAICKRWEVTVCHGLSKCWLRGGFADFLGETIEKAAALCVIDDAKRGVL